MSDIYISPTVGLCPIVMPSFKPECNVAAHDMNSKIDQAECDPNIYCPCHEYEHLLSLAKAEAEKRPFEAQNHARIILLTTLEHDEVIKKGAVYENVPLPACEEVEQYRYKEIAGLAPSEWFDLPDKFYSSSTLEYRTVTRFIKSETK